MSFSLHRLRRGRPTLWTPEYLRAEGVLKAWWCADDLADGAVSSWPSRAGTIAPLTQATGSMQPVRSAAALNGKPGVTPDGIDDFLSVSATTGLPTGAVEGWQFVLYSQPIIANTFNPLIGYGSSTAQQQRVIQYTSGSKLNISISGGSITDATAQTGIHVVAAQYSGGNLITAWIDDNPTSPATAAVTINTATSRTRLFAGASTTPSTNVGQATIRHALILSAISTLWRQKLAAYLTWEGGINLNLPVSNPYRLVHP